MSRWKPSLMKDSFLCTFSLRKISVASRRCWFSKILCDDHHISSSSISQAHHVSNICVGCGGLYVLLPIPSDQRQIQQQRQPIPVDQEERRQERVHAGLGDNVHVEAVAQVDGVEVVALEVAVHDGEEDLQEEVDGVEEDGEEEEPVPSPVGLVSVGSRCVWSVEVVERVGVVQAIPCFARHAGWICGSLSLPGTDGGNGLVAQICHRCVSSLVSAREGVLLPVVSRHLSLKAVTFAFPLGGPAAVAGKQARVVVVDR